MAYSYYDPNSYTRTLSDALLPPPETTDVYAADTKGGRPRDRGNSPPDRTPGGGGSGNPHGRAARQARREARDARNAENAAAGTAGGGAGVDAGTTAREGKKAGYPKNRRRQAVQRAMDELLAILGQHGQTDPARMNTELTDISRGAEAGQQNLDEYLASQGLSGSGVGVATHAAIGAAGEGQRSRAIAEENAKAEERRRSDLLLMLQLVLNPRLARKQMRAQVEAARAGGGKGGSNWMSLLGQGLGGASGQDWGNMGGGGDAGDSSGGGLAGGEAGYGGYDEDPGGTGSGGDAGPDEDYTGGNWA